MINTIEIKQNGLKVVWEDGLEHLFHPLWLRESSTDIDYRDAATQMRIPQASAIELDISLSSATVNTSADGVQIEFSDGHRCEFDQQHLYDAIVKMRPDDLAGGKFYWDSNFVNYETFEYSDLQQNENTVIDVLNTLSRNGFVCVQGMPVEVDEVERFAQLIGPIRETNWGRVTDVRNMPNPYDLTVTARSLSPHVDNPYRMPAPGYIFMHCLRNDAQGGESIMIDGFAAAMKLKQNDAQAFHVLTTISPNFRHAEDSAILEDYGPMIEVDEAGRVVRVRFSNRTEQIPPLDGATLDQYYRARKSFAQIIFSKQMTLITKLRPGDGFIWDNFRILHGRTAFDVKTGDRHMRHCYMDRDTVSSRYKCLLRDVV